MVVSATRKTKPLFSLGNIYLTPGAIEVLNENRLDVTALLRRHVSGDWGDLDNEDKQMNDDALNCGARIFSGLRRREAKIVGDNRVGQVGNDNSSADEY